MLLPLRVVFKPRFLRVIVNRCRKELAKGVTAWEIQIWLLLLVAMITVLVIPATDDGSIFILTIR